MVQHVRLDQLSSCARPGISTANREELHSMLSRTLIRRLGAAAAPVLASETKGIDSQAPCVLTIISLFATRFWSTPTQRTLSVARPSARSHRYHLVTKASGCFVLPPPRSPRYGGCNKENTTTKRGRLATEKHLICCIDPTAWLLGPSGRMQRRCFGNLVVPQDEVTF